MQIDPNVQDLIDRLERLDLARPQHDKAAIEQAVAKVLAHFGVDGRPCIWAEDPLAAYGHIAAAAEAPGHPVHAFSHMMRTAPDPFEQPADRVSAVYEVARLGGPPHGFFVFFSAVFSVAVVAPLLQYDFDVVRTAIITAAVSVPVGIFVVGRIVDARNRGKKRALSLAEGADLRAVKIAAKDAARDAIWNDLEHAVLASGGHVQRLDQAHAFDPDDTDAVGASSGETTAALAAWNTPLSCRASAVRAIYFYASSVPTTPWTCESPTEEAPTEASALGRELVHAPMLEAFVSGLFLCWIMPNAVVCLLKPALWSESGRLHRADGPAVLWPSGEVYHFWHGIRVPAWLIEEPSRLTTELIRAEPDPEVRGCMVQIYGLARFLRDVDARLVHEDALGGLWKARVADHIWLIVAELVFDCGKHRVVKTLDVAVAADELGWSTEEMRDRILFAGTG